VTEKPRKRYHVAAVQYPLSCKGMAVSVNAGGLNATPLIVFREHMITRAFYKLLSKDVAEQEILFTFWLAEFQILGQYVRHGLIDRHDQRLSIFGDVNKNHGIIKVNILHPYVHKASLAHTGAEKKVCHNP